MVAVLSGMDLEVTQASGPQDALAAIERAIPAISVAVLDVNLKGASGIDLLRQIKQRDPSIEVVIVTGFETVDVAKRALRLGACDFIPKPFDVPAFESAVRRALKLNAGSREATQRERELSDILAEMGPAGIQWVRIMRGVVHDVANMLFTVRCYHHRMDGLLARQETLSADDTRELKGQVSVIGRQLDAVVRVLRRQMSVWKVDGESEAGAMIHAILNDLVELVQCHPEARLCSFELDVGPEELRASMPAPEGIEILLNILLNAAQSGPGRRVNVSISARLAEAPFQDFESPRGHEGFRRFGKKVFQPGDRAVRVMIKDTGDGIPAEVLHRLGSVQISTKGTQGTGLGFGVAADGIERHQGLMAVRSTQGRGTEIELLIPAAEALVAVSGTA